MSDFELFKTALSEFESDSATLVDFINGKPKNQGSVQDSECTHANTVDENGYTLCVNCGEEISKFILHEKEWRYYGNSDNKHASDPNRVQMRKNDERTIYKDVENMGFNDKIVTAANKLYMEVTNGNIKRGNSRKAIIFACIYLTYKSSGNPQSHETILKMFDLEKKVALQGLKDVVLDAPKSSIVNTTNITPLHLIDNIMNLFKVTETEKDEVKKLYQVIHNRNSRLNRSRPQSCAAGIIYYWICKNNKDISLKTFAKKANLSELTISKVAKIIEEVIDNQEVVVS